MTHGITVPARYKSELRREGQTTDQYKPQIKAFVLKNEGLPIINQDWVDQLGVSSATGHIRKLIDRGYLTRKALKGMGTRKFAYEWHDKPLTIKERKLAAGGAYVKESPLEQPKEAQIAPDQPVATKLQGVRGVEVDQLFLDWLNIAANPDHIQGVIEFRKYCKSRGKYLEATK